MVCTALNQVDYKVIESGNGNWTYPHYPGVDVAGEVVSVGDGAEKHFAIGD